MIRSIDFFQSFLDWSNLYGLTFFLLCFLLCNNWLAEKVVTIFSLDTFFLIHKFLRLLFLGLLTTANYTIVNKIFYNDKNVSTICGDIIARKTNNEFNKLLTAKKDFR